MSSCRSGRGYPLYIRVPNKVVSGGYTTCKQNDQPSDFYAIFNNNFCPTVNWTLILLALKNLSIEVQFVGPLSERKQIHLHWRSGLVKMFYTDFSDDFMHFLHIIINQIMISSTTPACRKHSSIRMTCWWYKYGGFIITYPAFVVCWLLFHLFIGFV